VVGTSLHLLYSTCTLPEPNAVQIYQKEKKDSDVICKILSKPVNTALKGPSSEMALISSDCGQLKENVFISTSAEKYWKIILEKKNTVNKLFS